jgi:hypothetical protein
MDIVAAELSDALNGCVQAGLITHGRESETKYAHSSSHYLSLDEVMVMSKTYSHWHNK